jgi:Flp pilus assembly protein TadG
MLPLRSLVMKASRPSPTTGSPGKVFRGLSGRDRPGVAAVEAAVTLPLLVFLVFGAIEVTNGIFLSQTLAMAAYEAAREAAQPGASMTKAHRRADEIFQAYGVKKYTLQITPSIDPTTPRGTVFSVRVEAPTGSLSAVSIGINCDRTSTQQVTMVRN